MIRVLFSAAEAAWPEWKEPLRSSFAARGLEVDLGRHHHPDKVDVIVCAPNGPVQDFAPYQGARLVQSLWAGVEGIVGNTTLTQPLARMVDPGLTEGMVEYVAGHALRHHLGMDAVLKAQDGHWDPLVPPLARDRGVTVLGLGALGSACAAQLAALGFRVSGWSASPKEIAGVTCLAGADGLTRVLRGAEILVLLLPLTAETDGLIDAAALGHLPGGAVIVNPGRGGLIVDADLLAALETGAVHHATLDTFRVEPLPAEHPFWAHPGVTVTPHIASATRPETAAPVVAENTARAMAGEPILHLVDRARGY
ncbi:glyoxylate/hydroxypyruvate reductase A [Palleronia marisminoris]|uniref:Glyoxylate/hydroxypyruvate reductase A n=1 Tax=Palleronia marisminoris TaxID=315423 RepID=A0A1Y5TC63_9RHOB|nr:glyoxylate/hydroxypyruvate reductase A [Palleronia marisminoris]SFH20772.1 glyoxylate/hydroxypyruvate reductase A [Palleronia marisminoris]SLN57060.1 Glyoxylate/hydroxypyruvate reductase A [Palleronia marisminoris]